MENKAFLYTGLGFIVLIDNPEYCTFEGEEALDFSPKDIMDSVFRTMPSKRGRLTGAHIRFMRTYLKLTRKTFGLMIGVAERNVLEWEAKNQDATGMDIHVEILLRIRCRFLSSKKSQIPESFIENLLADALDSSETGEPIHVSI